MTAKERKLLSRLRLETWRGIRRFRYRSEFTGFSGWPPPPGWLNHHPLPLTAPPNWSTKTKVWPEATWVEEREAIRVHQWEELLDAMLPAAPRPKKRNSKPKTKTLSFEEAGRAIRILLRELGHPYLNRARVPWRYPHGGREPRLDHRVVIWDARSEANRERAKQASVALIAAGIIDYRLSPRGWFRIRIPKDCFASSFYRSDDPQEWARKDKQRHDAILTRQQIRERQRAEWKRARWLAYLMVCDGLVENEAEDAMRIKEVEAVLDGLPLDEYPPWHLTPYYHRNISIEYYGA